jgi:hypothetical protein
LPTRFGHLGRSVGRCLRCLLVRRNVCSKTPDIPQECPARDRKPRFNAGEDFSFACRRTGLRVARAREPLNRTVDAGWPRDRTECRFYLIVLQTGWEPARCVIGHRRFLQREAFGFHAYERTTMSRPDGAPPLAPCIRQTCLPFTGGAPQVTLNAFLAQSRPAGRLRSL